MNIAKEIAEIRARKGNSNTVVDNLQEQKIEIDKQIRLVCTVAVACSIQDMINTGEFSKFNISKIQFYHNHDSDYGNVIKYLFKDENNNNIKKSSNGIYEITDQLDEKFDEVSGFELDQISEVFKDDAVVLDLDKSFEEKFINLMLPKELLSILEHGELQNNMPTNEVVSKKPKM
jgi:hypothetical protein